MKIGVNFLLWAAAMNDKSVELIEKSARLGFDGVEIFIDEPRNIDCKRIRKVAADHGLGITCCAIVGPDRNLISDDPATRRSALDYLKASVAICHEVGSRVFAGPLYAGVGVLAGRPRTHQEWDRAVEGLSEAARDAEAADVSLCLEPLNRFETYFVNIAEDAVRLVRDVGSPNVRVMLDTFHMNIEEKSLTDAVRKAGPLLGHFHCSENDRGTPGTGHVDWPGVFGALRDIGYDGWLVIESFVLGNEAIARAAAIWRDIAPSGDDLARDGLAFLRQCARFTDAHGNNADSKAFQS
jgi:D-psicose/D-tagatose/L-ribulose 3-epimerase